MQAAISREGRERMGRDDGADAGGGRSRAIPGLEPRSIPGLEHRSIPGLEHREARVPSSIPGLGGPPMQQQQQQQQDSGLRPEDDLEYQEYKLFKQQELIRKQREERERMERELALQEQQYVQPGATGANPYHDPNAESGNNTMGHSQSFGAGFSRNNISDPTNPHRSHYDHDHNVESGNSTVGRPQAFGAGYTQNNISDPSSPHRSHYDHDHNMESQGSAMIAGGKPRTYGRKSFFTNPKNEHQSPHLDRVNGGQQQQQQQQQQQGGYGSPTHTYASPEGGKTKHMQALSLMTGPSMNERNEKLQKEMEYRALLKQQMEEAEAKKEKARREKKERQEQGENECVGRSE